MNFDDVDFYEDGNFTGTENWYKVYPNFLITDGVQEVSEKFGAYWVLDTIWSVAGKINDFSVVMIVLNKEEGAVFYLTDGNDNVMYEQKIPYTDLTVNLEYYAINDGEQIVVLLPTEY